jgi:four helix bundle protein
MPLDTCKKKIESYQDLIVWRKGVDLVVEMCALAARLPATERFSLCSQLKRAAVSVPANVAEGLEDGTPRNLLTFFL